FGTIGVMGPTMRDQNYVSLRVKPGQVRSGLEVTNELLSFLFDQTFAAELGLVNIDGSTATLRNDDTIKPQVTPYDLFVRALRGMDARFDDDSQFGAQKKADWRAARSELIDAFLDAQNGAFTNPAIATALPILGTLIREQVSANCPDRETS